MVGASSPSTSAARSSATLPRSTMRARRCCKRGASVIAWHMIPFVPIAFAVLALLAWRWDARERRAYEATLSEAERRQLRALRRVHPAKWRVAIALGQAETLATAAQDAAPRPRKIRPKSTKPR